MEPISPIKANIISNTFEVTPNKNFINERLKIPKIPIRKRQKNNKHSSFEVNSIN
jgi:hypothetical protein